jgi:hypothetical protein
MADQFAKTGGVTECIDRERLGIPREAWNVAIKRRALEERELDSVKSQNADSGLCGVELKRLEPTRVIVNEVT